MRSGSTSARRSIAAFAVGEADHFKAFFAQDSLAHALRVRAIVSQQDSAHQSLDRPLKSLVGWQARLGRGGWGRGRLIA